MKTIYVDSREQPLDRARVIKQIEGRGYNTIVSKQAFGDYRLVGNDYLVIDRKKSLNELSSNVGKEHTRIVEEISLAESINAKIIFLVEHGEGIKKLEDVKNWNNPLLVKYPKAMCGEKLYKILDTMQDEYNIEFVFCDKENTGDKIVEILEEETRKSLKRTLMNCADWMWENGE